MEAAVANVVSDGTRGVVIVTGYFGDRLAQIFERYGARVRRIDVEWGRAVDPQRLRDELRREGADVVGIVHAETSTGVRNPGQGAGGDRARARRADDRRHGDVARRPRRRSRRMGRRRRVLVHAEVHRRAVGPRADCRVGRRARAAGEVPQLLSRSASCSRTTGSAASITTRCRTHADLRAARSAADGGGGRARGALRAARAASSRARGRPRRDGPVAAAARGRAAVDAEHGARAGRRGRGGGATHAADDVQHRGRRGPRSAGRQDLARRTDGRELDAADRCCSSWPRSRARWRSQGHRVPAGAGVAAASAALRPQRWRAPSGHVVRAMVGSCLLCVALRASSRRARPTRSRASASSR